MSKDAFGNGLPVESWARLAPVVKICRLVAVHRHYGCKKEYEKVQQVRTMAHQRTSDKIGIGIVFPVMKYVVRGDDAGTRMSRQSAEPQLKGAVPSWMPKGRRVHVIVFYDKRHNRQNIRENYDARATSD